MRKRPRENEVNYWPGVADCMLGLFMIALILGITTKVVDLIPKNPGGNLITITSGQKEEYELLKTKLKEEEEARKKAENLLAQLARERDSLIIENAKLKDLISDLELQVKNLLNDNDRLKTDNDRLIAENQKLKEENERLKGENDKPPILVVDATKVSFDRGEAELSQDNVARLNKTFEELLQIVEKYEMVDTIEFIGHTDSSKVGSKGNLDDRLLDVVKNGDAIRILDAGSNADLGLMRAISVKQEWEKWLKSNKISREIDLRCYSAAQGIPPEKMNGRIVDDMARRIEIRFTQLRKPAVSTGLKVDLELNKDSKYVVKLGQEEEIKMIHLMPGQFTRGSSRQEDGRDEDETVNSVTLTREFWLGETEVTRGQWYAVMEGQAEGVAKRDYPTVRVSWYEALDFCAKLNKMVKLKSGLKFALPTEAQWEFACRSGSNEPYAGNLEEMAWYDDYGGSHRHPVRTKKPNAWGFYDMHGNVWEWCSDGYGPYSEDSYIDPTGFNSDLKKVNRGGGWHSNKRFCRSAYRDWNSATYHGSKVGFRLAIIADSKN